MSTTIWWQGGIAAGNSKTEKYDKQYQGKRDIPGAALRSGDRLQLCVSATLATQARERIASGSAARLARGAACLSASLGSNPDPAETPVPGKVSMLVEFYAR